MAKISAERLSEYRRLAHIGSLQDKNDAAGAIYQRMRREGAPVTQMRAPEFGMFMAPYRSMDRLADVDIACVGVPMENSVPLRTGTDEGPAALREWSQWYGPVHEIWGTIPFESCNVCDVADVKFRADDIPGRAQQLFEIYEEFRRAGINTLSVGGEHTMTYPIMKSFGSEEPLGMIHIDAHADTGAAVVPGDEGAFTLNDASPFRHAVYDGVLDPTRCIQIGLRGRCDHFWDFSRATGMTMVSATEFYDRGVESVIAQARAVVGDGPCYVTIDSDGIDPVDLPGTGLPEAFGIRAMDVRRILRGARGLDVIGADLTELCPPHDPTGQSANLSAALCFEMLCLLTDARVKRRGSTRKTHWNLPQ
jgi:agmatinase